MERSNMRYFSMFSGIGGFELGISRACDNREQLEQGSCSKESSIGIEVTESEQPKKRWNNTCIGFSEIDKYAIKIYESHFGGHKNYGDATRIVPESLPDFDLLVGGFPCQAFSIAGKRLGFEDTRGTLFFDIARILKVKRPRMFLLENVKGLLSHDNGRTFKTIITTLAELGYDVEWQVLNSKDFGVPQNRERVFIVGHLGNDCGGKVFPIGISDQENIVSCVPAAQGAIGGGQGAKTGLYRTEGMKIRRLTPTECERLQGYPDGWTAGVSDSQRYKTLGNSVTVNVIEAIMRRIIHGEE